MSNREPGSTTATFVWLSILFWALIATTSLIWYPIYTFMKGFMQMHSEYTLLEQVTNLSILVMLVASLLAYSRASSLDEVRQCSTLVLFALVLYFSENNYIAEAIQPLFGAYFILRISWQLLHSDKVALLIFLAGVGTIFLGAVSDVLLDAPTLLADWPLVAEWRAVAHLIEEHFDLWGIALMTYAAVFTYRHSVLAAFSVAPGAFFVLLASLGLVASGNAFGHWKYNPSMIFESISTTMVALGLLGIAYFDKTARSRGIELDHFHREGVYLFVGLAFVALPIMYGGTGAPFSLVLWLSVFYFLGKVLVRDHPSLRAAQDSS